MAQRGRHCVALGSGFTQPGYWSCLWGTHPFFAHSLPPMGLLFLLWPPGGDLHRSILSSSN